MAKRILLTSLHAEQKKIIHITLDDATSEHRQKL